MFRALILWWLLLLPLGQVDTLASVNDQSRYSITVKSHFELFIPLLNWRATIEPLHGEHRGIQTPILPIGRYGNLFLSFEGAFEDINSKPSLAIGLAVVTVPLNWY